METFLTIVILLVIVPLAFMLCWNGGLSNAIDGVHNMDYIEAALTCLIPVFLFGVGSTRD